MKKQLIKVSRYAKMKKLTRAGVYAQIKRGDLACRKIDGVMFVII